MENAFQEERRPGLSTVDAVDQHLEAARLSGGPKQLYVMADRRAPMR